MRVLDITKEEFFGLGCVFLIFIIILFLFSFLIVFIINLLINNYIYSIISYLFLLLLICFFIYKKYYGVDWKIINIFTNSAVRVKNNDLTCSFLLNTLPFLLNKLIKKSLFAYKEVFSE